MRKQRICWLNSFYYLIFLIESVVAVPKFEVTSVSTTSIVVKMVSATNVSRFEMDVTIFDLDRLREFRKTELSVGRHDDQVSRYLVMNFHLFVEKDINYFKVVLRILTLLQKNA